LTEWRSEIIIPVDVANPGQFFACCGLLELADLLWPEAEGHFDVNPHQQSFRIRTTREDAILKNLLESVKYLRFESDDLAAQTDSEDDEEDDYVKVQPIKIQSPVNLLLDWWADKSIKPWAGRMEAVPILKAMLDAVDPTSLDPLNQATVAYYKGKKREPFYFDYRRGCNAHPLDSGFSPDTQGFKADCFPTVEAMCFVGLQRARPAPTGKPNQSRYGVWTEPLPINVIAPVVCGSAAIRNTYIYRFDNFFRTDQRKYKSYSRATLERILND
jgi:CRISPR-associated protein Csx14